MNPTELAEQLEHLATHARKYWQDQTAPESFEAGWALGRAAAYDDAAGLIRAAVKAAADRTYADAIAAEAHGCR